MLVGSRLAAVSLQLTALGLDGSFESSAASYLLPEAVREKSRVWVTAGPASGRLVENLHERRYLRWLAPLELPNPFLDSRRGASARLETSVHHDTD